MTDYFKDLFGLAPRTARETQSLEEMLARLPQLRNHVEAKFRRVARVKSLPSGSTVLDIGAAQGLFVCIVTQMGLSCTGLEPSQQARDVAREVAAELGLDIRIDEGAAESLPYDDASFDFVHAQSVIEHVADLDAALSEIYRVLREGGVFWFNSASKMSPVQSEISGFPFFGWYPDVLKRRIMLWARDHRPGLIGHTRYPAMHWFSPRKARRLLTSHGFREVYDRWDIRGEAEGSRAYALLLRVIRSNPAFKLGADVLVPGCSFLAVK